MENIIIFIIFYLVSSILFLIGLNIFEKKRYIHKKDTIEISFIGLAIISLLSCFLFALIQPSNSDALISNENKEKLILASLECSESKKLLLNKLLVNDNLNAKEYEYLLTEFKQICSINNIIKFNEELLNLQIYKEKI